MSRRIAVVITCDHPEGCDARIAAPTQTQATTAARANGWRIGITDHCPNHPKEPA